MHLAPLAGIETDQLKIQKIKADTMHLAPLAGIETLLTNNTVTL